MRCFFLGIVFFLSISLNAQRIIKVESDIALHETIDSLRKDFKNKIEVRDVNLIRTINTKILYAGGDTLQVFFPAERAIAFIITGNFRMLLNDVAEGVDFHYNNRTKAYKHPDLHLLSQGEYHEETDLIQVLNRNVEYIYSLLNKSILPDAEQSFVQLYIKSILAYNNLRKFDTEQMKSDCQNFLSQYPASPYSEYVEKVLYIQLKTSNIGFGAGVFTGYNNLGGGISDYFRNYVSVGVNVEGGFKKLLLKAEFAPSFSRELKQTFNYKGNIWSADSTPFIINGNVNLGYITYDSPKYRFTPFVGLGYNGARVADGANMQFRTSFNCGIEMDWKFAEDNRYSTYEEAFHSASSITNWHLRFRLGYSKFQNSDPRFNGYLLYTKLEIGLYSNPSRKIKTRRDQNN